jgi:outer membrane protein
MKVPVALLLCTLCVGAETRTMTLRQATELALQMNPDVVLARLEQRKARAEIDIVRDAFYPKVYVGSGAAYTSGFPTSIDGNAPAIVQAKTQMALFDRPTSYRVALTAETARGAEIDIGAKQEQVGYQVASLFLEAAQIARRVDAAQQQIAILTRTKELTDTRVTEGRDLPIASKRADVELQRARKHADDLSGDLSNAESSLAQALGLSADDRIHPATEERLLPESAESEQSSMETALRNNREIKKLESNLQVSTLEGKSYRAERLPKVDLVAQWSLLGKYNNYEQYFQKFQRNNFEIGAAISMPLLPGKAARANAIQTQVDIEKVRVEIRRTQERIKLDIQKAYVDIHRAETARDLARADLDLARDQVSVDLAQNDEGRIPMSQVEASRMVEQEKWLAYYESQHAVEAARLNVLKQTGTLLAALK